MHTIPKTIMANQENLVTTCTFKGREYVMKMNVANGTALELSATDKFSAEEWNCCYDATYIENQTRKTGNFKHFEVFVSMLKSGLLKSSDCVSLDLLNFEDLELLRSRRILGRTTSNTSRTISSNNLLHNENRRYLILTYAVEFDRVHYPLALEYCGPPDPQVLQAVIRRLEAEMAKLQEKLAAAPCQSTADKDKIKFLEHKVDQLLLENRKLTSNAQVANRAKSTTASSNRQLEELHKQFRDLEDSVNVERKTYHRLVRKLREEKAALLRRVHLLEGPDKEICSLKGEGGTAHNLVRCQSNHSVTAGLKWSNSKLALEQARLEDMRANLQHYSCKARRKAKPASKCQSAETFNAAEKIIPSARHRSCSGSSAGSRRSCARPFHSASLDDCGPPQGAKPRGRSRRRRESSASSTGSAAFEGLRSRQSSVSSNSSTRSGRSDTRAISARNVPGERVLGPAARQMARTCGHRKGKENVKDLESRIKTLQKILAESKPV